MSVFLKNIVTRLHSLLPVSWHRVLRRRYYLRVVKNFSETDWEWSSVIKLLVPSGGSVLDIGANVGYLSGLFARWVGSDGKVVSVEPIPATYDVLSHGMKILYPDTVSTLQCCVSDVAGEVTMAVPKYDDGRENYYESRIVSAADASAAMSQFKVPALTLELLVQIHCINQPLSLIKIDVEGHELSVINGGADYFSCNHPPLLIEVAGDPDIPDSSAAQLFSTLAKWGYTPHVIKNNVLHIRVAGDKSVDYLFK